MKITDYEKVTQLLANNVLLVDGGRRDKDNSCERFARSTCCG